MYDDEKIHYAVLKDLRGNNDGVMLGPSRHHSRRVDEKDLREDRYDAQIGLCEMSILC